MAWLKSRSANWWALIPLLTGCTLPVEPIADKTFLVDVVTMPKADIERIAEDDRVLGFHMGNTIYLPGNFSVTRHHVRVRSYRVGPCRSACAKDGIVHVETTGFARADMHYLGKALKRVGLAYNPPWLLGHEFQHRRGFRH